MTNFYKNTVYKMTDSYDNKTSLKSKDSVVQRNFIVPAYSRPLTGMEDNGEQGTAFKSRPIKHWRKQLNPRLENGVPVSGVNGRRAGIVGYMGVPGGSSILGKTNLCGPANCTVSSTILSDTILRPVDDVSPSVINEQITVLENKTICVSCNPENNIIKSASTILSKTYYPDRKGYLQSRCLLYEQRLSGNRLPNVAYFDANGNLLTPNGTNKVEQRATENCLNSPNASSSSCKNGITIYKPSNHQYATQGAVDSSSRIERLKYNTITKNGSMNATYGTAGANANALYNGTNNTSYFLKSKNNSMPCTYRRDGSKTSMCFKASLLKA